MIQLFADHQTPKADVHLQREIKKLRKAGSRISEREFAQRKRARKLSEKSRRHNRRFH